MKECPQCGYQRQQKDDDIGIPPTECPKCGIIYDKVTAAKDQPPSAPQQQQQQRQPLSKSTPQSGSKTARYAITALVAIIAVIAVVHSLPYLKTTAIGKLIYGKPPTGISYVDTEGQIRMVPSFQRPALVGFWIQGCRYCARVMSILNRIRQQYPPERLDVVAFYLNEIETSELRSIRNRMGYDMIIAEAQPPVELIAALDRAYRIRGPGRDIYVVDTKGKIRAIDTSDLGKSRGDIESEIIEALRKVNP